MTNKNPIITAFAAVSLAALALSCSKSEIQNAYSQQDKDIESIVSSLAPEGSEATVDYLDGAVRVTVKHGEGDALGKSGTVSFFYAGHRITGTSLNVENLFATNNRELAETYAWTVADTTVFKEVTVDLSKESLVKGLKKGIVGVKSGDECYILFNGKLGFGNHTTGKVPANSGLAYHLWITGVTDK